MFGLIEGIFSFAFGMLKMVFGLAWGAVELVFGLLGGILSLLLSLGGIVLVGALVAVAIVRRRNYRNRSSQSGTDHAESTHAYDVDSEEFTSFYDQFRTSKG